MRTTDSERRAFLRSLKPRIVEIQALVATNSGIQVSHDELQADIAAGIAEIRAGKPERRRPAEALLEG